MCQYAVCSVRGSQTQRCQHHRSNSITGFPMTVVLESEAPELAFRQLLAHRTVSQGILPRTLGLQGFGLGGGGAADSCSAALHVLAVENPKAEPHRRAQISPGKNCLKKNGCPELGQAVSLVAPSVRPDTVTPRAHDGRCKSMLHIPVSHGP